MISIGAFFLRSKRFREGVMEVPFRMGRWNHFRRATENLYASLMSGKSLKSGRVRSF